jgi:hypothetical protein
MRAAAWVLAAACAAPVEAPLVAIAPPPPVCVSEFMASNAGSVVIDGAAPDWVELHNPGAEDQSLDGWTLGDRVDEDGPAVATGQVVPAGGVLVLVADDVEAPGHLPFRLSADGEALRLVAPDGREDVVVFPPMPSDFVRRRLAPCCAEAGCWRLEPDATLGVL